MQCIVVWGGPCAGHRSPLCREQFDVRPLCSTVFYSVRRPLCTVQGAKSSSVRRPMCREQFGVRAPVQGIIVQRAVV